MFGGHPRRRAPRKVVTRRLLPLLALLALLCAAPRDADATVDGTGRFHAEGGVDDFPLKAVSPGSRLYAVTVPASAFRRYGDKHLFWQAYRLLPPAGCRRIPGTTRRDCFQQSTEYRELDMLEPTGYLSFEPNDTPATAATDFLNYAFPFAADRKALDGEGDVQKFVISVGWRGRPQGKRTR